MTIQLTEMMTGIIVEIIVEVLSVLALATKQIDQGRLSTCAITYTSPMAQWALEKFLKKLFWESEVEDALQKLDNLTQDEARMTSAQTLGVVHRLAGDQSQRDVQSGVQCWLSPPNPSTNHDSFWKAHHTGTASWFFKSGALRKWKKTGSLLWIHGKRTIFNLSARNSY
jgi:hypothetical protein